MDAIIKIEEKDGRKVVSARELYEKLGFATQHYANWYRKNIVNNPYAVENEDWVYLPLSGSSSRTQDFALTINFAKRLSMMARTETGEIVRKYFVKVEQEYKNTQRVLSPYELIQQLATIGVENERRIQKLESDVANIKQVQVEAEKELLALPMSTDVIPELTTKEKVRMLVNRYAKAMNIHYQAVWDKIYNDLYYRYKVHASGYAEVRSGKSTKLDAIDKNGHIDKLFAIISDLCKSINITAA